jgi:serine/threonine protein kinase
VAGPAADVQALVALGRHEDAAHLLLARGAFRDAADLYSAVWKYAEAVDAAVRGGLLVEAYRHALTSKDEALRLRTLGDLLLDPAAAREGAALALSRGRKGDAAHLLAAAGDLSEAARRFEDAGELKAAAELYERAGELKSAGRLYERHLKEHEDDALAALSLGRILLRFGRAEHAARALQPIERHETHGLAAARLLVEAFEQLGLSDAAASVLDRLRVSDPQLPPTVAAYLAKVKGPAESAAGERPLLVGRYRVKKTLGAGGTGRVLLAEDTFFGRDVAIKVLSSVEGPKGRDALVRFAREARLSASLEHPNVVRVLDYFGEGPFLIMELMVGGTLEDRLTGKAAQEDRKEGPESALRPLAPAVTKHVLSSVLRALDAAHRRGVVHRDVKPGNVFFGTAGEVKLGDFGAAHLLDVGATRTGALIGTLAYMAPEQIASASAIHPATDLYAVGVLSYATLLGVLPFPGPDFVEQHLTKAPPTPSAIAPPWIREGPPQKLAALDALLLALLAKSPDERPESALVVDHALDALPWDAWQRAYDADASPSVGTPRAHPSVPPEAPRAMLGRYLELEGSGPLRRARDELLLRDVELFVGGEPLLARFAKVSSPYVQAVYASADGVVVLEAPEGETPMGPLDARAQHHLERALEAIHQAGLTHGAITRDAIVMARDRALLRLPLAPTTATPEQDRLALQALAKR